MTHWTLRGFSSWQAVKWNTERTIHQACPVSHVIPDGRSTGPTVSQKPKSWVKHFFGNSNDWFCYDPHFILFLVFHRRVGDLYGLKKSGGSCHFLHHILT
jgi:hypothetical protein